MANADTADTDLPSEAENEDQAPKLFGFPKKLVILGGAAAVVVLLLGLGATAYFLGWIGGSEDGAEEMAVLEAPEPAIFYELPEITVNLSTAEQRAQYLRLNVSLEIESEEVQALIDPNLPRILDVFQTYLRELRVSDLEGSAGLFRLKSELQRRINLAIYPAEVKAVLFSELVVQ